MSAEVPPLGRALLVLGLSLSLPGAPAAQPSGDSIRVAVVRGDPAVDLEVHGDFTLRALRTGDAIEAGRNLRSPVRAVPEGLSLGDRTLAMPGVRIEPVREAAIHLNGSQLRGALEIVRQQDQTLLVVNHLSLEEYLQGVLSREAPDHWPPEALKAVAIAARTYALAQRFLKAGGEYDVTGDVLSQDYGGKSAEKDATSRAVRQTAGWVLAWKGRLFPAFYHSTCGGVTEHAKVMGNFEAAPLRGGVLCRFCEASPFASWQRRFSAADIGWALRKSPHGAVGTVQDVQVLKRSPTGRIEQLSIVGSRRRVTLSGYDFRALLGFERIRSPQFTLTRVGDSFVLEGRGWGHGVGLCQWGAAELARRGVSAPEILSYYYPEAELVHVRTLLARPVEVIRGGP
jgi:stage II sporulation protein D